MRRSRKTRTPVNVSLFPFLAVLICTLGVLIVMLVIAAKQADTSAAEQREEFQQAQQAEVNVYQDQLAGADIRIRGITRMRSKVLERLNHSKQNRSHLRNELRNVEKLVDEARREFVLASNRLRADLSELSSTSTKLDDSELESLEREIEEAQKSLVSKRAEVKDAGPNQFVIVPYKGGGGTFRRPIFIECNRDEIRLQPLGIVLKKSEFDLPLASGNMLDAALLTIREYWERYDLAGEQGSPYPLIVVRPDGAETFVLARRAMKSWDDEFGYELVDSELDVEFGKYDDQLAKEVKQTIAAARQRQNALARQRKKIERHRAQFASRSSSRPGFRVSGNSGGFVQTNDEYVGVSDSRPGFSGADALRQLKQGISSGNAMPPTGAAMGSATAENRSSAGIGQPGSSVRLASQSDSVMKQNSMPQANSIGSAAGSSGGNDAASLGDSSMASNAEKNASAQQAGGGAAGSSAGSSGEGEGTTGSPFVDLSIAKKKGPGWALPTRTPGAVGYLRPIRVVCYQDRFEMVSGGQKKTIPFLRGDNRGVEHAVESMVDEIWKQVDGWGIAGTGNYWKPQLRVTVAEGAQTRYQQLAGLLYESGLAMGENTDRASRKTAPPISSERGNAFEAGGAFEGVRR